MSKFKLGDRVKVKCGNSTDSRKFNGKIGTIIRVAGGDSMGMYYILDIEQSERRHASGIWESELQLVSETDKKVVKIYGIVGFVNKYYK